ncbi:TPA: hypothetical protein EYO57_18660 [Candidatus Poribacteria bacterium]|nr:hypothetical protein [Candidatus Poribacteria bacterium]
MSRIPAMILRARVTLSRCRSARSLEVRISPARRAYLNAAMTRKAGLGAGFASLMVANDFSHSITGYRYQVHERDTARRFSVSDLGNITKS